MEQTERRKREASAADAEKKKQEEIAAFAKKVRWPLPPPFPPALFHPPPPPPPPRLPFQNAQYLSQDITKLEAAARRNLDLSKLQQEARENELKARQEENRRKVEHSRKVDYLVRATRDAERAKVAERLPRAIEERERFVAEHNAKVEAVNAKRVRDYTAIQAQLPAMRPRIEAFVATLLAQRRADHDAAKVRFFFNRLLPPTPPPPPLSIRLCCSLGHRRPYGAHSSR
jgi:hypothetical protein